MANQSHEISELVKFIADTLKESKDFVLEQAPSVIQEFITWKRWEYLTLAVLLTVFAATFAYLSAKAFKWALKEAETDLESAAPVGVLSFFAVAASVIFTICAIYHAYCALQVWIAPKVFLIEFVSSALKG